MARLSIDDMVQRDPRITKLAAIVGWSKRETVGCLVLDIWPICYDQRSHTIVAELIDIASGHEGFSDAMVRAGLANWVRGNRKVRIKGAQGRIEYLEKSRIDGRVGGLKSGESRRNKSRVTGSNPEGLGNPSATANPTATASVNPNPKEDPYSPRKRGRPASVSKSKPGEPTPSEAESIRTVLDKLSAQNGIAYSGTNGHAKLIIRQLRSGVSEMDLRAVIGYCALELAWKSNPEMAKYLRPETLFGPQTISRYLDPARTWFDKLPRETE